MASEKLELISTVALRNAALAAALIVSASLAAIAAPATSQSAGEQSSAQVSSVPSSQPAQQTQQSAAQPMRILKEASPKKVQAEKTLVRPLLQELSVETQSLYNQVKGGIVRVQLPPPKWLNDLADEDELLGKWNSSLNNETRQALARQREEYDRGQIVQAQAIVRPLTASPPATMPGESGATPPAVETPAGAVVNQPVAQAAAATQPGAAPAAPSWRIDSSAAAHGGREIVFQSSGSDAGMAIALHAGGDVEDGQIVPRDGLRMTFQNADGFAPNNFGLLIDDAGHIVVPMYIEKETVGAKGVPVAIGDSAPVTAKFVASDRLTNMTVLQLEKPIADLGGKPIAPGANQPPRGSMILLLQPNSGAARLAVWNGGQRDYGVAVAMDGTVLGFARYGQFLSAAACKPVADQLVAFGVVKRPKLGVALREIPAGDTLRQSNPALDDRPALYIDDVVAGSAAARGGLQKGDFILAIETGEGSQASDQPVGDTPAFAALLLSHRGATRLLILRDGRETHLTVELDPE